ncbi:hypothetical protein RDI58_015186 [Solanum bulbocastanum]|uniref:Uncharacterized protein n=1 Tax=Solanum bulbocastanum TaxID=147425 RepID=A0AAN8TJP1_SOLBU
MNDGLYNHCPAIIR